MGRSAGVPALAVVAALALGGACAGTPEAGSEAPPPEVVREQLPAQAPPAAVRHAGFGELEQRLEQALGGATGSPQFAAIAAAAAELQGGLALLEADRPPQAGAEYDELVKRLGELGAELRAAAEAGRAQAVRRAFQRTSATCVRCHVSLGKGS
ncbi:MAG: hypothetical protein KatS3mg102_1219 [Planctomycetota bacterium]|nr:MAG: hypothetical protein KatS3mg102_1219 [Planctomycetota bacterium]